MNWSRWLVLFVTVLFVHAVWSSVQVVTSQEAADEYKRLTGLASHCEESARLGISDSSTCSTALRWSGRLGYVKFVLDKIVEEHLDHVGALVPDQFWAFQIRKLFDFAVNFIITFGWYMMYAAIVLIFLVLYHRHMYASTISKAVQHLGRDFANLSVPKDSKFFSEC